MQNGINGRFLVVQNRVIAFDSDVDDSEFSHALNKPTKFRRVITDSDCVDSVDEEVDEQENTRMRLVSEFDYPVRSEGTEKVPQTSAVHQSKQTTVASDFDEEDLSHVLIKPTKFRRIITDSDSDFPNQNPLNAVKKRKTDAPAYFTSSTAAPRVLPSPHPSTPSRPTSVSTIISSNMATTEFTSHPCLKVTSDNKRTGSSAFAPVSETRSSQVPMAIVATKQNNEEEEEEMESGGGLTTNLEHGKQLILKWVHVEQHSPEIRESGRILISRTAGTPYVSFARERQSTLAAEAALVGAFLDTLDPKLQ
ncbi:hypothetical protein HDU98_004042 [Podochytrium sp. JEL0797]|nr:hypothetical protein HDU98_004042 [Podochytrium sp. JEL0797]